MTVCADGDADGAPASNASARPGGSEASVTCAVSGKIDTSRVSVRPPLSVPVSTMRRYAGNAASGAVNAVDAPPKLPSGDSLQPVKSGLAQSSR